MPIPPRSNVAWRPSVASTTPRQRRARIPAADVAARLGRIEAVGDVGGALADADIVVEAVFEDLA